MRLRSEAVERIVMRLQGTYGQQFAGKFSRKENGVDVGVEMFKETLAVELAGFDNNLDAIAWALANLPGDHVPNSIQLRDLCRHAPKKEAPALAYTPTAEDVERAREMSHKVAAELKPKFSDGIDRHWATHPRSEMQLKMIFDAAKNDARFRPCVSDMVADGICTTEGRLLKKYAGTNQWVKA